MEDDKKDDVQMLVGVSKQIADIAEKSKKKRSMTFLGLQETLKDKMVCIIIYLLNKTIVLLLEALGNCFK